MRVRPRSAAWRGAIIFPSPSTDMSINRRLLLAFLFVAWVQASHVRAASSSECLPRENSEASLPVVDPLPFQTMPDARLVLSLSYDQCGDVVKATVERSSGSEHIDAAARSLALTWRVAPDRSSGKPVKGKLQVGLDFSRNPSPSEAAVGNIPPPPPPEDEGLAHQAVAQAAPLPVPYRYFTGSVRTLGREPPLFPPLESLFGVGGTTVLIIEIGPAGNATQVSVERSSRNRSVDRQAIQAAKSWRFLPSISGGRPATSRVRIPVDFNPYETWTMGLRDRDPARSRVPLVAHLPDGSLPGYVPDPLPLGVDSVAEALDMLKKKARHQRSQHGQKFLLEDENGISKWSVCESGCPTIPILRRWRLVNDGSHAFWVSTIMCGSADQSACTEFKNFVERGSPPQRPEKL